MSKNIPILDTQLDVFIGLTFGLALYYKVIKPKFLTNFLNKIAGV